MKYYWNHEIIGETKPELDIFFCPKWNKQCWEWVPSKLLLGQRGSREASKYFSVFSRLCVSLHKLSIIIAEDNTQRTHWAWRGQAELCLELSSLLISIYNMGRSSAHYQKSRVNNLQSSAISWLEGMVAEYSRNSCGSN